MAGYLAHTGITREILLRAMPAPRDVVLSALIAMSAGGAASLALVAELSIVPSPWGQVIDSAIGVEVAISLVPPTAMIGIGWTLGTPEHTRNGFYLLLNWTVASSVDTNSADNSPRIRANFDQCKRLVLAERGSCRQGAAPAS